MYPRLLLVAGPGEVSLALPAATQLPPATSAATASNSSVPAEDLQLATFRSTTLCQV